MTLKQSLFLILFVFACFDSSAAECREYSYTTIRSTTGVSYDVYFTEILPLEGCSTSVFLTANEYELLSVRAESTNTEGLEELLVTLFAFDSEVFAIVEGALILAFLTSHFAGRIVRWLGKT